MLQTFQARQRMLRMRTNAEEENCKEIQEEEVNLLPFPTFFLIY
jgi:hypothetical protein